jgi:hypothetical protein
VVTITSALANFMPRANLGFFTIRGVVCFTNDKLALLILSALRFLRETFGKTGGPLIARLLQHNP